MGCAARTQAPPDTGKARHLAPGAAGYGQKPSVVLLTGRSRVGLCLIVAFGGLWVAWGVTRPGGDFVFLMFEDGATVITAGLAACLICLSAGRSTGRARVGLFFIGAGIGCWAVGEIGWMLYDMSGAQPFPSILDVIYLAGYVPLGAGAVLIASPDRSLARARTALDGLALVLTATAAVWHLVLQPTYSDSGSTLAAKAVGGAYPMLDLVVLFALMLAVTRYSSRAGGTAVRVLCLGLALNVVSDVSFAFVGLHAWTTLGEWLNAGWVFGYLLIGLAAVLQLERPLEQTGVRNRPPPPAAWRQAAPLALLLTFVAFASIRPDDLRNDVPFTAMLVLAAVAIAIRQFVVVQDNVRLNDALAEASRTLEIRVHERTQELACLVSILEATPDFVVTTDLEAQTLYLNSAARGLFGVAVDTEGIALTRLDLYAKTPAWVADLILSLIHI